MVKSDPYILKHDLFKMLDKALDDWASALGPSLNSHHMLS